MRVLFVAPKSPDYLASCIWDGLQEVLGEENVFDAVGSPFLHRMEATPQSLGELGSNWTIRELSGIREGRVLGNECDFDLLVVNASYNRDLSWDFVEDCRKILRPGGKVAYLEGWDAAWQIEQPGGPVDAVFRKEISPRVAYPYACKHLTFAAPARWIPWDVETRPRPIDVSFGGNPSACLPGQEVRWPMLQRVFQTRNRHRSVFTTCGLPLAVHRGILLGSKVALCPSGADLTDSLRTMEVVAAGAIPILVGYPDHIRDDWFDERMSFSCSAEAVAERIDETLGQDLSFKRHALISHVKQYHTTAARAMQMLEHLRA